MQKMVSVSMISKYWKVEYQHLWGRITYCKNNLSLFVDSKILFSGNKVKIDYSSSD